jgi:PPM family protein phosphatase
MLSAHAVTHPGKVRAVNEDAYFCDIACGLFMVCDGLGGHHAGEVASRLAIDAVSTFMSRTRDGEDVTWPYGIDPALSFDGNRLMTAIKLANRRVFKQGESREDYTGMATTIVAAFIMEDRLVYSSVGDSRIYSFSGGSLEQLTQDDSWVTMMLGRGDVAPGDVAHHPMKHVLTNVVGARDQIECRVIERRLENKETLLLCSDGLHGALDPLALSQILSSEPAIDRAAEQLVQAALAGPAADNITALLVGFTPA